jgi:cell division protein FtsL
MSEKCPVCKVKQKGLCIHEKMMLGMMGVALVVVVLVLAF